MRLGYKTGQALVALELLASMRPRRMRLGYNRLLLVFHVTYIGFNEAEAHAPRIPRRTAGVEEKMKIGFNEAEAHAPRIRRGALWTACAR